MSGNFAIKGGGGGGGGGGVGRLMANAILNFHFDYLHTSLIGGGGGWSLLQSATQKKVDAVWDFVECAFGITKDVSYDLLIIDW